MRTRIQSKQNTTSSVTRIGPKHQITIPTEVFQDAGLEIGDYLEVQTKDKRITMTPKKLISKDDSWFYTPEWQAKEAEADKAIAKGKMSEPFSSKKELLTHLRKLKKRDS